MNLALTGGLWMLIVNTERYPCSTHCDNETINVHTVPAEKGIFCGMRTFPAAETIVGRSNPKAAAGRLAATLFVC
jgi:hypothetical protein